MVLLIAFTALTLLAAGTFALIKGDLRIVVMLMIGLGLGIVVLVPQLRLLQAQLQHAIDAALPIALR